MQSKQDIRQQAKDRRKQCSSENPRRLVPNFQSSVSVNQNDIVAFYWACNDEIDPKPIIDSLSCRFALPSIQGNTRILKFLEWTPKSIMEKGAYGIDTLQDAHTLPEVFPDIVIVPLLAFDEQGYRLGYGGGYYDASLKTLRQHKKVEAIGIAYDGQKLDFDLPKEDHDEKLDMVITPQHVYRF